MLKAIMISILLASIFFGCESVSDSEVSDIPEASGEWLIPQDQVFDGGPGKDGIPALINPEFVGVNSITYLNDDDLVIAVKIGDIIKVYPHPILDWHEIINDGIRNDKFSLTYCPLTGSGIAWNSKISGTETTFGVSGLLYNTNLIAYDRRTNSNWSQMKLQCVSGVLKGSFIQTYPIIETSWSTWKNMYPDSKVVSKNTGFSRNYGRYPYDDYRTNNSSLIFPVSNTDNRLPKKERVLGIIGDSKSIAIRFDSFPQGARVLNTFIDGKPIVVAGNKNMNVLVSYSRILGDGTTLEFIPIQNSLPTIMTDADGNLWNIFGEAIDGPRKGEKLNETKSYIAYWFAWAAFYPETELL